jgi:hypothetical protein
VPELSLAPLVDAAPLLLPVVPDAPDELSLEPREVPAPVAPCDFMLSAPDDPGCACVIDPPLLVVEESAPAPPPVCASATEDTDATKTNDNDRIVVFNVMNSSLNP